MARIVRDDKVSKAKRPQSVYAKEDAKLTAANRRAYPDYDLDVVRFGVRVADYNAGWITGTKDAERKEPPRRVPPATADIALRAIDELAIRFKGKWPRDLRRQYERATTALRRLQ